MNRADRKRWESARTLADLRELTALWLEGEIGTAPGYDDGPAPETTTLVPVLAAACRAGFVTHGSQPGIVNEHGEQRAAVEGFAAPDALDRLRSVLHIKIDGSGLLLVVQAREAPRRMSWDRAMVVTTSDGQPFTRFGTALSRRHLRDSWEGYGICHRTAVAALCAARQVTVADPEWGRNDRLWPALERFAATIRTEAQDTQ